MRALPRLTFSRLLVKDETAQKSGAFKYRGASTLLDRSLDRRPVVAASTGNHACGLTIAAAEAGLDLVVFVPTSTPQAKLMRIRSGPAHVIDIDGGYDACEERARRFAARRGWRFVHSFDDDGIIEGHRSLFVEIREQVGTFDRLYVPIGGGGLVAAAIRELGDEVEIIGVEHVSATAMRTSLAAGAQVVLDEAAGPEGLCVRQVGSIAFDTACAHDLKVSVVSDGAVTSAMRLLWEAAGIRAEAAGAAATAAAISEVDRLCRGLAVVCVVSGGNIDIALWEHLIATATLPA